MGRELLLELAHLHVVRARWLLEGDAKYSGIAYDLQGFCQPAIQESKEYNVVVARCVPVGAQYPSEAVRTQPGGRN